MKLILCENMMTVK